METDTTLERIQPAPLTDMIALQLEVVELRQENAELRAELALCRKQLKEYFEAYEVLRHELSQLKRHRFGQRSERDTDAQTDSDSIELPLPNFPTEPDGTDNQADDSSSNEVQVSAHTRRRNRTPKDLSHYPRRIEIIPLSEADKLCSCGCDKKFVRYEIKESFDYQPAVFSILEQRREVFVCPKGCSQSMKTAQVPLHVLPKAKVTESLLAHIIVSKLHHRQPLYHLEKYVLETDISRATMARWMVQLVKPLQPIFNLLKEVIIEHDVAAIDATTLQVLKEPGRKATTHSYLYCLRGGSCEKSVVLYAYNDREHKAFVDTYLDGFSGHIHMDADIFFETLLEDESVNPVFCHSHARRKFEAIAKQAKNKKGLSHKALSYYKKLYRIERQAKNENLDFDARYQLRLECSQPILEEFRIWLDENEPTVLPKSPLAKALNYLTKRWAGFMAYLADGRLELDNNGTEQEIKPFTIIRKNFLFCDSVEGAHAIALHMTLTRTALKHGLNPEQYYDALLRRIPYCKTLEDYESLLPWNIQFDSETSPPGD